MMRRILLFAAVSIACASAQKYYTYIGNLAPNSALLAWGTADGVNTIGRSSPSHGEATVHVDNRSLTSRQNWMVIGDLKPDAEYPYLVSLGGKTVGQGVFRTWPAVSTKLVFFVIGDYGTGNSAQYGIAKAMWAEFQKRSESGNPVRFVLTTGDNIYGDLTTILFGIRHTGSEDVDWAGKFFEPYQELLKRIPFYPTVGNHDGNETERRGDLTAYLDNFFFPGDKPARYYSFQFADLAEFFGLDSTLNAEFGGARPAYLENGPEFQWMRKAIPASKLPWKIPYYHHPVFNAGPRHVASHGELAHWMKLFQDAGVKVVFNGHEHNLQFSEVNPQSGGIRYVTSGAGGELRAGNVQGRMARANIAGWAPQNNFLVVEIEGKTMRITPLGFQEVVVKNPGGSAIPMPLTVTLP